MGCLPAPARVASVCTHRTQYLQRTQPDGGFFNALQLSFVFAVRKEGTVIFVMQSFSLDLHQFSENVPDNRSLDYVRNIMIRQRDFFFIYARSNIC